MIKRSLLFGYILILVAIILSSCLSGMIALEEIHPQTEPGSTEEDEKYPPVSGLIVEIEEVGGEQKYIYMKLGNRNKGIKRGVKGYIFNDTAMNEKIGKFQFIEVYRDFSKGRILELNYKIKQNAVVFIETNPERLIK